MEAVQIFDAQTNIINRESQMEQDGSTTFKLPANKSGKIPVKFNPTFPKTPLFLHTVNVIAGNALDVFSSVSNLTEAGCELHVCNSDCMNECSVQLIWRAK